jgi:hypothetical protein
MSRRLGGSPSQRLHGTRWRSGAFLQGPLLGLSGRIASSIVQHQILQSRHRRGQTHGTDVTVYGTSFAPICYVCSQLTMTSSSQNAIHHEIGYYPAHPNKGPSCADAGVGCAAHSCFQWPIMLPCRFRNFVASSRDVRQLVIAIAVAVGAHAGKIGVDDCLLR